MRRIAVMAANCVLALAVLVGVVNAAGSFDNLGNVGVTGGSSWWSWQQPVFFYEHPDGSISVSGTIANGGLNTNGNPYSFVFQTSQVNGVSWVYISTVSSANFGQSGSGSNTSWTSWNFTVSPDKVFVGGDGIYLTVYDAYGNVVATTGGRSSAALISSPNVLFQLGN